MKGRSMDLGNPDLYTSQERYAMWRRFVGEDAVVWSAAGRSPSGFWSVFSHHACLQVLRPSAPFTSEYGMLIGFDASKPDRGGGKMIVATDGERHTKLRRVLGRAFTPSALSRLERFLADETARLLDFCRSRGEVDIAVDVGPYLPAAMVCELLGIPLSDRDYLIALTNSAFASPDSDSAADATADAHSEIFFYFHDRISACQRRPGSDLISALLGAEDIGIDEVLANCYNLLIGGNQTSRHLVSGAFHCLSAAPDLLGIIRDEPASVRPAIEEMARWISPGMHVLRVATRDISINGQQVREGEALVAWIAAGNRDPRVFHDPDHFIWDRLPNSHLSFGYGPHNCLGAQLARMEIDALLTLLAARANSVALAAPPVYTRSNLIQGYKSLPVTIDWASSSHSARSIGS